MARLNTNWNQSQRVRGFRDTGSALALNMWKLASEALLHIENEGFETNTRSQRLDVVVEFLAYLLHLLDRLAHDSFDDNDRAGLIGETAEKLVEIVLDNRNDLGETVSREDFITLLNIRSDEYADCHCDDAGPGFTLRRVFGEYVREAMGAKDRKWIPDYVMEVAGPKAYTAFRRSVRAMLDDS